MTTISTISSVLFENDQFWSTLGRGNCMAAAFGQLNCMLSITNSLRSELLEKQPTAAVSLKRKRGAAKPDAADAAEGILPLPRPLDCSQPQSILNRAVGNMFPVDGYSTMSIPDAMLRFAMTRLEVTAIINKAADSSAGRVTVSAMLMAAMARKGGLHRVAVAAASRARSRAKAVAAFMPTVRANIETWFAPLLRKVRPMAHERDDKNKRVKTNYIALRCVTRRLQSACACGGVTRQQLVMYLGKARMVANRVDAAYDRATRTLDRQAEAKATKSKLKAAIAAAAASLAAAAAAAAN
jgi:hypothetical protein